AERKREERERYQDLEAEFTKISNELTNAKGKIAALESVREEQNSAEAARRKEEAEKYLEMKEKLEATTQELIAAKEEISAFESDCLCFWSPTNNP
ncbi:MAG: hypothetical protein PHX92_01115, partial [Candidatus Pacebacteria bacterium]|nr:hypothetical protein [Candidatus Paceibacterota bacterium]